jgi:hypothetical protein
LWYNNDIYFWIASSALNLCNKYNFLSPNRDKSPHV